MERDRSARQQFTEIVARSEDTLNLAEAALLVAKEEYPDLDTRYYLGRLDRMADEVRSRLCEEEIPERRLEALNRYLFESLGFKGNRDDYYDPRNSFLNDVLDRRTGIPITISTVYLEVGWRVGMPLQGVGFPGHFLVKYAGRGGEVVIDPFGRGAILTKDDCQDCLDRIFGQRVQFHPGLLAATSKRQILIRILRNLKGIYLAGNDHRRAVAAVERILIIDPGLAPEIRDRGILRMHLGRTAQGIVDLERYLTMNPTTDDVEEVRRRLRDRRQAQARLN
jgi:regulator of sirC expression with transglutaminase-like and TPR domain